MQDAQQQPNSAGAFTITRRVQFAETDAAGVLHFANYYRIMEEVEHAFWRSLGQSVWIRDGDGVVSWPRVRCECEYLAPARFEDELLLRFSITGVGERSITFEVEFLRDDQRIAVARTKAVCCAIDRSSFRSIPIPETIRNVVAPFVTVLTRQSNTRT